MTLIPWSLCWVRTQAPVRRHIRAATALRCTALGGGDARSIEQQRPILHPNDAPEAGGWDSAPSISSTEHNTVIGEQELHSGGVRSGDIHIYQHFSAASANF